MKLLRTIISLCLIPLILLTGCSVYIADSGKYSDLLVSHAKRDDILEKMGTPNSTETLSPSCIQDTYMVKGKLPEGNRSFNLMVIDTCTFFLAEFILFPIEAVRYVVKSFSTSELHVDYCKENDVYIQRPVPVSRLD